MAKSLTLDNLLVIKDYINDEDALKQDLLVSGTNIKTINNNSILGSGNISITGGVWGQITGTLSAQTDLQSALDAKVDTITYDATNHKFTKTIAGTTTDVIVADNTAGGTSGSSAPITSDAVNQGLTSINSAKADKATTLAGYGITDAKIASGVITLGGSTITPITSHQDISGKEDSTNKTQSISSSSTTTQYPSAKAVYDYIQSLNGNNLSY